MLSYKKRTTHISLKKHLTSCQKVFHEHESAESLIYCLEHCVHGQKKGRNVDLIAIIHVFSYFANIDLYCHIALTYPSMCVDTY